MERKGPEFKMVKDKPAMNFKVPRRNYLIALFSLLMLFGASTTNSVMDTLVSRYDQSVFSSLPPASQSWFDPRISYKNKWKDGDRSKGESYYFSSTVLVPVTDAWHLFKFITILFLYAAILAPFTLLFHLRWYHWILIYLMADFLRGLLFEFFYTQILIK